MKIYYALKRIAYMAGALSIGCGSLPMIFSKTPALQYWVLGAFLIFIGYCVSKLEFDKSKYIKYLNEKNDGIYIYYAKFGGEEHEIKINTKNKTIELKSGKNSATLNFDNIKSWRYNVSGISKVNVIGSTNSVMGNFTALSQASAINNQAGYSAWDNNGFFIHTDALANPVWHIKIIPKDVAINLKSDKFWKSVAGECEVWMNVMNRAINK